MILAGIFSYFASSGKWNLCPLKTTAWGGWQSLIAAHLPPNVPGLWEGSLEWGHDTGVWMVREATHAGPGWRKQFLSPLWVKALEGTDFYSHAPRGKQVGYFSACATSPEREKQTEEEAERLQMHNVSKCELCSGGWWGNWTARTLKERKKKQNINLLKSHNNCQMECVCLKKIILSCDTNTQERESRCFCPACHACSSDSCYLRFSPALASPHCLPWDLANTGQGFLSMKCVFF